MAASAPSVAHGPSVDDATTSTPPEICIPLTMFPSQPLWMMGDYFSHMMPVIMAQYITFVLVSQLIHCVHRHLHLRQTRFVSNIMAAVIMGPSLLGRNEYLYSKLYPTGNHMMMPTYTMAVLGINLYVFISAVKIDTKYMMMRAGKTAFKVGVPAMFLSYVIMLLCVRCFRIYIDSTLPGRYPNVIMSFYLAFSSSPNLVTALSELNLMSSETSRFAIFTAVFSDFTIFFLIMVFESVRASQGYRDDSIFFLISVFTLMVSVCLCVVRPWAKWIVNTTPMDQPVSSSSVVGITLGAILMQMIGGMVFGNFLLGPILFGLCIMSGPPLGSTLVNYIDLVAEEILLPFFYIQLGSKLNLTTAMNTATFYLILLVLFVGSIVKFVAIMLSSRLYGFNTHDSVSVGLMLNFSGLVSVFTFDRLGNIEIYSPKVRTSLIISSLLLNTVVSPLVKTIHNKFNDSSPPAAEHQEINPLSIHASRKDSEFRAIACVYDESNVSAITNLLDISNLTIKTLPCSVCTYVIHMSQLDGQATPVFGPHFNHTRICNHNGCNKILSAFSNYTRFSKEQVIVMPFTAISPFKTMHEEICRLAKDKNVPLIILPFYNNNNGSLDLTLNQVIGLRSVYIKIQCHARCTVGIILDQSRSSVPRSSSLKMNRKSCTLNMYNVAVIFIGGPDDREALAYGLRMLGRPGLKVTLLHISMTDQWETTHQDDDIMLLKEFKIKTENTRNNATYHDMVIQSWEKVMKVTRRFVRKYNLVIVGQRQGSSSLWMQGQMIEWIENPELGLIGDMLASPDFNFGETSVLVLHHHRQVAELAATEETSHQSSSKWKRFFSASSYTVG